MPDRRKNNMPLFLEGRHNLRHYKHAIFQNKIKYGVMHLYIYVTK